ncbi:TNF receptor-associated factor 4 isoform X2 [Oopsacas minuta]|uniref:TNF receptor-associated factor 4 isoform X2 n=1 Tax=Oopsacas minuta TaxID=111878 RepID=A0AAV7KIV6_9METZ|nr:TNF receptor-associated factor 4 isoform X2 [Oopsacas minuta]
MSTSTREISKDELIYVPISEDEENPKYGGLKKELLVRDLSDLEEKYVVCCSCKGVLRGTMFTEKGYKCSNCVKGDDKNTVGVEQPAIDTIEVFCPMRHKGCERKETISTIEDHLANCEFYPVACELNCEKLLLPDEVEEHVQNECENRMVGCAYCSDNLKVADMDNHLLECTEHPVMCPNDCQPNEMKRKELEQHINKECKLAVVNCVYSHSGCEVNLARNEMVEHENVYQSEHLRCLNSYIKRLESTIMRNTNGTIVMQINELESKLKGGQEVRLESEPFYVCLYKCQAIIELNDRSRKVIGVYVRVVKGEWDDELKWPFNGRFTFSMINKKKENRNKIRSVEVRGEDDKNFHKPDDDVKPGRGFTVFASHDLVRQAKFSGGDSLLLKICVEPYSTQLY